MTTNRLLPFGVMAVIIIGVLGALVAFGAIDNDGDSDTFARENDGEGADVAGICIEGATDCDDTIDTVDGDDAAGDSLGVCISEDDPNYNPDQPCSDVVEDPGDGDGSLNMCIAGATDCVDTPVDGGGDDPVAPGEDLAIEASFAALAEMGGDPGEVKVTGTRSIDWGDSCLGVVEEDVACAEVITPGWIVFLSGAGADYEFHTDLNGNAVYAPQ